MRRGLLACLILVAGGGTALAGESDRRDLDCGMLDRTIVREPVYVAAPRYAMFVFDAAGTYRVWAVLDKTSTDSRHYDVLYFDWDGDGDLTDKGERYQAEYRELRAAAGLGIQFSLGDVYVPGTGERHERLRIASVPKVGRKGVWFQMKWRGGTEISGGYGLSGYDTVSWADSPATAPVLHTTPQGTLSFATWGAKRHQLTPGKGYHLNVLVGHRGGGEDALSVVDEDFLDLARDRLYVTVIARDADGKEVRERTRVTEHC